MNLKDSEWRKLHQLHALFLKLEKESRDGEFNVEALTKIKNELSHWKQHSESLLRRLADLDAHIQPSMSVKHFSNLIVPLERILQKSVQDDDFLVLDEDKEKSTGEICPLVLVLDNLRSAFNVGSILRTADGLGLQHVYLCGYTPSPENFKVEKTALGADRYVRWSYHENIRDLIQNLKLKMNIVALETSPQAKSIYDPWSFSNPTALVLGNERFGLDPDLISSTNELRQIPMAGRKNSLNVGVCAAIVASEWRRQWTLNL